MLLDSLWFDLIPQLLEEHETLKTLPEVIEFSWISNRICILQQLLVSAVCSLFNGSPLCCMHQHVVGANQPPPARRHSRAQQPWKGEYRVRTEPNGNCHQSNHPGTCSQFLNFKSKVLAQVRLASDTDSSQFKQNPHRTYKRQGWS